MEAAEPHTALEADLNFFKQKLEICHLYLYDLFPKSDTCSCSGINKINKQTDKQP